MFLRTRLLGLVMWLPAVAWRGVSLVNKRVLFLSFGFLIPSMGELTGLTPLPSSSSGRLLSYCSVRQGLIFINSYRASCIDQFIIEFFVIPPDSRSRLINPFTYFLRGLRKRCSPIKRGHLIIFVPRQSCCARVQRSILLRMR